MNRSLLWIITVLVVSCAVILISHGAYSHEHGQDVSGWFKSLQNRKQMSCCDGSDAMRLDDVDWESKDGHFRVRIEGQWYDVPEDRVVDGPNKAGTAMVWPWKPCPACQWEIRCFMMGGGT
jgi:hypothetical protein